MNIFDEISELLRVVKVGPNPKDGTGYQGHLRTLDGKNLYFSGQDIITFETISEKIWKGNNDLFETVTLKAVKDQIIKLLQKQVFDGNHITQAETDQFIPTLISMPIQAWEVFRPLYGANLPPNANPLALGPFTIYHAEHHKANILAKYPHGNMIYDLELEHMDTMLIMNVMINARENNRANELSDNKFRQFDNIIRYMLGPTHQHDVAVNNFNSWAVTQSLIFSAEQAASSSSATGSIQSVQITDQFFQDSKNGNLWIWNKLNSGKLTDLEKRIFAAVNWIGKGAKEKEPANSFVQYIFALESLFTFQKKGVLVSPSIANQLSEFTAFILGNDLDSRKRYLKTVKDLYGKRSAVAHGGSQVILKDEVVEAYEIVKNLVVTLITQPDLQILKSVDELQQWVDNKKYS
ncbi:HEPN domain-containing protein [Cohnella terricola]|uniref:Uncharacterized protein n=1 Tax=Cohnella terricola TaxID=1289167 RepID=A0A559JWR2_9BACL|nr:HEPN domain-containing protein [Cohnella terricola]TVY04325.1 hypothetical protein FPZ45_01645 [Cohnella terricola]